MALLALPAAAQEPDYCAAAVPAASEDVLLARLIQDLSSHKVVERACAAWQLARLGPRAEPAIPLLVEMLGDDEAIFGKLDENGHDTTTTPAICASSALIAIGRPAVAGLIAALQSRKANVRLNAARTLSRVEDPRIFEALLAAGRDSNDDVREAALAALPVTDDPRVLELFVAAAADRNPYLRELGAERLGAFRDARAADALIKLLRHDDWADTVCNATDSLADIGDARAVPALLRVLADTRRDSVARSCAAWALTEFDDPRIYEGFLAAADDPDVRFDALKVLGVLGDRRAVPLLIDRLATGDESERVAAQFALGELGDPAGVEPLIAVLLDTDPPGRYGPGVNERALLREHAATALGAIGDTRALEPLVSTLTDWSPNVRAKAALALGELGDARAVEPLIAALADAQSFVRADALEALGELGDARAVEPAIAALSSSGIDAQRSAATALRKLADPRSADALRRALEDSDPQIRTEAAAALRAIEARAGD